GGSIMPERDIATSFQVARNPDADSRLGYLVRLPVGDGDVILKAADTWPRTNALYCHPAEWPEVADIIESVPVRSCRRRGVAIDLVLERARQNRAQFVFTTARGRPVIFWQSPKTTARSRPSVRVPTRRASAFEQLTILVDTRERYPYRFAHQHANTQRQALPAGDYGMAIGDEIVAVVERKTLNDLAHRLIDGNLTYALAELATLERAAVVVEDRYSALFKLDRVPTGFLPELLARVQVRYPNVPIVFCDTRPLAEEWTFRFLAAALAHLQAEHDNLEEQR
ncbi:MAG TPA: ERCC4 domain-containing protein, partial [Acidimicrobiales bacterium]|nr:ERCC4 domain-containing protein [Acidimicrobiales bacterium]